MSLAIKSPAFQEGESIPARFARAGGNAHPPLSWSGLPEGTRELALIVDDPDAPGSEPFVHWIVHGIPPATSELPEGTGSLSSGLHQGRNSFGNIGYDGPAPPPGAPHHYHFKLFALDRPIQPTGVLDRSSVFRAIEGHALAQAELVGVFQTGKGQSGDS